MRGMVNRFLDDYCKEDIVCIKNPNEGIMDSQKVYLYHIKSGDIDIVFFSFSDIKENRVALYRSNRICNVVQSMFTLTYHESAQYIKEWISDKLSIKTVDDLINFIPK